MNLAQLYYFRKLAQLEHYTQAAQELFISQPSLSSAIASMEEELSIKLFQKRGRNVKLTKDGREFYQHVCRALDALQDGIDTAHEKSGTLRGSIDLAAPPSLLLNFIPNLILSYQEQHSTQITFQIHNLSSVEQIADGLRNGTFDFGFFPNASETDSICALPVSQQEISAFVSKQHPLAEKIALSLKDLQGQNLITLPETTELGQIIRQILENHTLSVADSFTDEFSVGSHLSQNHHDVVITTSASVLTQCSHLKSLPIVDMPAEQSNICLLYSKKNHISKPMERFLSFVTEQAVV